MRKKNSHAKTAEEVEHAVKEMHNKFQSIKAHSSSGKPAHHAQTSQKIESLDHLFA